MSKKYEIKNLSDIFQIPENRLDEFFVELREWVDYGRPIYELNKTLTETLGEENAQSHMQMNWIDDGKRDKKIIVEVRDGSEEQPK